MALWKCNICGEIFEGEIPPEICPVCGAETDAFVKIEETKKERNDDYFSVVIIGGGIAASEAAKTIREYNSLCKITMIIGEKIFPYNRPGLSDYIASPENAENLFLRQQDFFTANKIDYIMDKAVKIDRYKKMVKLENGNFICYDKLLIATGANSFCPIKCDDKSVPLYTLRTINDAEKIISAAKCAKNAVIIGGGILGIEAALAFVPYGISVTVIELGPYILSNQADKESSEKIKAILEQQNINIYTNCKINSISDCKVKTDIAELPADFVLVSAGVRAETSLAVECGIETNKAIVVDNHMLTSDKIIYAAGDCTEFSGNTSGLWCIASAQGIIAGKNICGIVEEYIPAIPSTVFSTEFISFFSAGNFRTNSQKVITSSDKNNFKKLFLSDDILIAAVLFGDTSTLNLVLDNINKKIDGTAAEKIIL